MNNNKKLILGIQRSMKDAPFPAKITWDIIKYVLRMTIVQQIFLFLVLAIIAGLSAYLLYYTVPDSTLERFARQQITVSDKTLKKFILGDDKKFQWQWAGENWIGVFEFSEDNKSIRVELTAHYYMKKDISGKDVGVKSDYLIKFKTKSKGIVSFDNGAILINDLLLEEYEYTGWVGDKKKLQKSIKELTMTNIRLLPSITLHGRADYIRSDGKGNGGMLLTDEIWQK